MEKSVVIKEGIRVLLKEVPNKAELCRLVSVLIHINENFSQEHLCLCQSFLWCLLVQ